MDRRIITSKSWALVALFALGSPLATSAADPPKIEVALSFRPSQKNVPYDVPSKEEAAKCEVRVERKGGASGWMVLGPEGQILRRYLDTDGDNVVDQWRYYRNGIEIYRDIDTNGNQKTDEFRFVNEGGSRWGVDKNEDGKVDSWKILSAEEASQIAVEAILARDVEMLRSVLVSEQDIKDLGIADEVAKNLLQGVADPDKQLSEVIKDSKVFAENSTWIKLDSSSPGVIPADDEKAKQDLFIRENAVAILDLNGETGLAQIGEILRNGEVWKLAQVPRPIEGDNLQIASSGMLIQPAMVSQAGMPGGISEKMRELLEQLQKLDSEAPTPAAGVDAFAKYNASRADILGGLIQASETDEDRDIWTRQFADSVSAAVATGVYTEGLEKLNAVQQQLDEDKADAELRAYVRYRSLFAEYNQRSRDADTAAERVEVQKWWTEQLAGFVSSYDGSPDAAEALLQLALAEEFSGNLDEAAKWYGQLAKSHSDTNQGKQAAGAVHRLGLKGKPFEFTAAGLQGGNISASNFKGKVLLVLFWSTTCRPCDEDLPTLLALHKQYAAQGFEILGVNLDPNADNIEAYLTKHQVPWPQIHEPGGQESKPSRQFGIISVPTMILVGRDGNVVSRGVSAEDLKEALPTLLTGK